MKRPIAPTNPAVLAGMKGTAPASAANEQFLTCANSRPI